MEMVCFLQKRYLKRWHFKGKEKQNMCSLNMKQDKNHCVTYALKYLLECFPSAHKMDKEEKYSDHKETFWRVVCLFNIFIHSVTVVLFSQGGPHTSPDPTPDLAPEAAVEMGPETQKPIPAAGRAWSWGADRGPPELRDCLSLGRALLLTPTMRNDIRGLRLASGGFICP